MTRPHFVLCKFDLGRGGAVVLQLVGLIFQCHQPRILPDRSLSLGGKGCWKAFLAEFCKGLKVLDVIVLSRLVQKSRSSIYRRSIGHVVAAVYPRIGLRDVLRSFNLGIPFYIVRQSATINHPVRSEALTINFLSEVSSNGMDSRFPEVSGTFQNSLEDAVKGLFGQRVF